MTAPPGWTTDPEELDYENEWATEDSLGQTMTRNMKLGRGEPIMFHDADCTIMFKAGERYYFWNRLDCNVYEILDFHKLSDIITLMIEKGERHLRLKALN